MLYKPFSLITPGDIFTTLNHPGIPLMKTDANTAIWLQSFWSGRTLHRRGTPVTISEETAVVCPAELELGLPMANVDPIDPRRKFWQVGDQAKVGLQRGSKDGKVAVFAGLFLYSGFGSGNYYSATGEIFGGSSEWASERASAEDIPFVYHDSFEYTDDDALARVQARAREQFERTAATAVAKAA